MNTLQFIFVHGHSGWGSYDKAYRKMPYWGIFPTVQGDHMWLQGGLLHRHDIRAFYLEMLTLIRNLP